jgi:hypothetical protein
MLQRTPAEVVKQAQSAAKQLQNIVEQAKSFVTVNGKRHLYFEAWQTIGAFHGVCADVEWTKPLRDKDGKLLGFECRAIAHNPTTGVVLSHAEAECRYSEKNWSGRDHYALRSMVQTRAMAKSLRNVLAWQVVLAGYKATPAEEMEALMSSQPTGATASESVPPAVSGEVSATARQIGEWLLEMNGGDKAKASAQLKELTAFTVKKGKDKGKEIPGVDSIARLSPGRAKVTYHNVEKLYTEWKKGGAESESASSEVEF